MAQHNQRSLGSLLVRDHHELTQTTGSLHAAVPHNQSCDLYSTLHADFRVIQELFNGMLEKDFVVRFSAEWTDPATGKRYTMAARRHSVTGNALLDVHTDGLLLDYSEFSDDPHMYRVHPSTAEERVRYTFSLRAPTFPHNPALATSIDGMFKLGKIVIARDDYVDAPVMLRGEDNAGPDVPIDLPQDAKLHAPLLAGIVLELETRMRAYLRDSLAIGKTGLLANTSLLVAAILTDSHVLTLNLANAKVVEQQLHVPAGSAGHDQSKAACEDTGVLACMKRVLVGGSKQQRRVERYLAFVEEKTLGLLLRKHVELALASNATTTLPGNATLTVRASEDSKPCATLLRRTAPFEVLAMDVEIAMRPAPGSALPALLQTKAGFRPERDGDGGNGTAVLRVYAGLQWDATLAMPMWRVQVTDPREVFRGPTAAQLDELLPRDAVAKALRPVFSGVAATINARVKTHDLVRTVRDFSGLAIALAGARDGRAVAAAVGARRPPPVDMELALSFVLANQTGRAADDPAAYLRNLRADFVRNMTAGTATREQLDPLLCLPPRTLSLAHEAQYQELLEENELAAAVVQQVWSRTE